MSRNKRKEYHRPFLRQLTEYRLTDSQKQQLTARLTEAQDKLEGHRTFQRRTSDTGRLARSGSAKDDAALPPGTSTISQYRCGLRYPRPMQAVLDADVEPGLFIILLLITLLSYAFG